MYRVPGAIQLLVGAVSAAVLLSAVLGGVLALVVPPRAAWALFGFEAVTAVAGFLGVLLGLGRFREGPGLAAASVAGTVFAASVLGYLSVQPPSLGAVPLAPFLAGRVLAAAAIALAGAVCVLSRDPRAWPTLIKGIVLGLPVVAAAGVAAMPAARGLVGTLIGTGTVTRIVAGAGAFVVFGALLCASVHLIVRAFEFGRGEPPEPGPRAGSGPG